MRVTILRRNLVLKFSLLILFLYGFTFLCQHCRQKRDAGGEMMRLSRSELIEIAKGSLENTLKKNVEDYAVTFDKGNKTWLKYYADRYPNLSHYDCQAICFTLRSPNPQLGGGPIWVCIDRITGDVLQFDVLSQRQMGQLGVVSG